MRHLVHLCALHHGKCQLLDTNPPSRLRDDSLQQRGTDSVALSVGRDIHRPDHGLVARLAFWLLRAADWAEQGFFARAFWGVCARVPVRPAKAHG